MSTVIIGAGDDARARIQALETSSVTAKAGDDAWRTAAENLLKQFNADADELLS